VYLKVLAGVAQQGKDKITVRQLLAHQQGYLPSISQLTGASSQILTGWGSPDGITGV